MKRKNAFFEILNVQMGVVILLLLETFHDIKNYVLVDKSRAVQKVKHAYVPLNRG